MSLTESMTKHDAVADHINLGMLTLRVPADDVEAREGPMTVIVSGVGRSGTSMIAKVLDAIGVPMGKTDGLAVFEDRDFNTALFEFDYNRTRQLIKAKDEAHRRWGFKFASLQNHIFAPQLEFFRKPRLVIVTRDIVATASRSFESDPEMNDLEETLLNVTKQVSDMMYFVKYAPCPTLLISYEKFITFPEKALQSLAGFCGVTLTDESRRRARHAIEPNNPKYIELFHPNHRGNFDSVKQGAVIGWCAQNGSDQPVEVELLVDGVPVAAAKADIYRNDLQAAGIGAGCHGFRFDLAGFGVKDEAVLQVRTVGGAYMVFGSGRKLKDFPGR